MTTDWLALAAHITVADRKRDEDAQRRAEWDAYSEIVFEPPLEEELSVDEEVDFLNTEEDTNARS